MTARSAIHRCVAFYAVSLTVLLTACTNPLTDHMDAFFDNLSSGSVEKPVNVTGPGYAPAYPPMPVPELEKDM